MDGLSFYSAAVALVALLTWGYILSLNILTAAWDTILKKVMEIPPEAVPGFFESNHQHIIHLTWALVIIHLVTMVLGPLRDFMKPRWYSHIAVLAMVWAVYGQSTFAPAGMTPPAKATATKPTPKPRHP